MKIQQNRSNQLEIYSNLEGIKVGDEFMRMEHYSHKYGAILDGIVCTKVTPAQCEIGGVKYRLKDAVAIGQKYSRKPTTLYVYSVDEQQKTHIELIRRQLISEMQKVDFTELTHDQLIEIKDIINP